MKSTGYSSTYFLLCAISLFTMTGTGLLQPILSIFAKGLGASSLQIGLVVSGYWIARVLMEVPAGLLSSKFGYYKPMVIGLAISAAGSLLCILAADPYLLIFARSLTGLGAPLFFGISMTLVVNLFDASKRGSAMGLFQCIEFIGSFLGATVSGYLSTSVGFKWTFTLSAILSIIAVIFAVVPQNIRKVELKKDHDASAITLSSIMRLLRNRNLLIASSTIFAELMMSSGILFTIFPLYANEQLGISLLEIGLIMGARSAGFTIAMVSMGYISDRIGRRPVLSLGLLLTATLVMVLGTASTVFLLASIIFLLGISTGAIWIVCPVLAAEGVATSERGTAIGTYRTFLDLGSVFGPILMSTLQESSNFSICLYLSALILLINLIPALGVRETKGRSG